MLSCNDINFEAKLFSLEGKKIATGSDFDDKTGNLKSGSKSFVLDETKTKILLESLVNEKSPDKVEKTCH